MADLIQLIAAFPDPLDVEVIFPALTEKKPRTVLNVSAEMQCLVECLTGDAAEKFNARTVVMQSDAEQAGLVELSKEQVAEEIATITKRRGNGAKWSAIQNAVGLLLDVDADWDAEIVPAIQGLL